ncbi:hypothetical protein R6G85_05750 [Actinotignum urinale]|uniref:hypothetical protein n=1 Tax=Actinotignum urinale TaxID=190146 RepID=UPI0003B78D72|nr:hypothetical protein [Actinotignum urinale]MDY5151981.1 hypothetical protein [Actinotignum urinale]MDY5160860.1 hypothetical protein [Actinotignum urinale]WIK59127.1 hypothetical protein CJ184_000175 [Actinotignum urinale]
MNPRKILVAMLVAFVGLGLSACGSSNGADTTCKSFVSMSDDGKVDVIVEVIKKYAESNNFKISDSEIQDVRKSYKEDKYLLKQVVKVCKRDGNGSKTVGEVLGFSDPSSSGKDKGSSSKKNKSSSNDSYSGSSSISDSSLSIMLAESMRSKLF